MFFKEIMCKLVGSVQSTCVFFSSFSILLIAVDRYIFIIHPSARQISPKQVRKTHLCLIYVFMNPSTLLYINTLYFPKAVLLSFVSFLLAAMFSSPLFFLTKLDVKHHLLSDRVTSFCYEVTEQVSFLEKVKVRTFLLSTYPWLPLPRWCTY